MLLMLSRALVNNAAVWLYQGVLKGTLMARVTPTAGPHSFTDAVDPQGKWLKQRASFYSPPTLLSHLIQLDVSIIITELSPNSFEN